ncbi:hypothetical protein [Cognataquiflexum rubidum]|uniref:hypothetical protein n=1 Tax=Cognataquiflexum rubidum TaxID=2922273 RepID=UPI001F148CC4|nr:hypothetical protein [Cognataquiflexum rubidum]MCH6236502.1 hypothetical protein [Cognataquiflexum rubidum]
MKLDSLHQLSKNISISLDLLYKSSTARIGFILSVLVMLALIIWSLDKGLIFLDEAFYLLHLRDGSNPLALSNWFVIFQKTNITNLNHIRLLIFASMVSSSFFLGYAFSFFYFRIWPAWFVGCVAVFFTFLLPIPVQFVPNNFTLNLVFIYISIAFLFLGLGNKTKLSKNSLMYFSGLLFGPVPFIMITNLPLIGAIFLFVILIEKKTAFQLLVFWILGFLSTLIVFFQFFQSFEEFITKFQDAVEFSSFISSHGIKPLLKWHYNTIIYYLGLPLNLLVLMLCFFYLKNSVNTRLKIISFISFVIIFSIQFGFDITNPLAIFPSTLFLIIFFYLFFVNWLDNILSTNDTLVAIFLVSILYFATLGTDVPFRYRSSTYLSGLVLAILIMAKNNKFGFLVFAALTFLCFLNFLTYPIQNGWHRYKMVEQKHEVKIPNGEGYVKLDQLTKNTVEKLIPILANRENVLISDGKLWGYIYLTNAQAPYLSFWENEAYFQFYRKKRELGLEDFTFFEGKYRKFSPGLIEEIVDSNLFEMVEVEDFRLFIPKQN